MTPAIGIGGGAVCIIMLTGAGYTSVAVGMAGRGITGGALLGRGPALIVGRAFGVRLNRIPAAPASPAPTIIITGTIPFLFVHIPGTGVRTTSGRGTAGIKSGFCFSLTSQTNTTSRYCSTGVTNRFSGPAFDTVTISIIVVCVFPVANIITFRKIGPCLIYVIATPICAIIWWSTFCVGCTGRAWITGCVAEVTTAFTAIAATIIPCINHFAEIIGATFGITWYAFLGVSRFNIKNEKNSQPQKDKNNG